MTTSTRSAAVTGLPAFHPAISEPMPRRGFLAGLARLPLLGGSVALVGQPRAVAQPVTLDMLEAYKTWLFYERRVLAWEMANHAEYVSFYGGTQSSRSTVIEDTIKLVDVGGAGRFHRHDGRSGRASDRAALVLSTVGCDWRDDEAPSDRLLPLRRA